MLLSYEDESLIVFLSFLVCWKKDIVWHVSQQKCLMEGYFVACTTPAVCVFNRTGLSGGAACNRGPVIIYLYFQKSFDKVSHQN